MPVQLFASVTVTVYDPATTPAISSVVAAFDHKYVNGKVPAVTEILIAPEFPALHNTFCNAVKTTVGPGMPAKLLVVPLEQPFKSVTVTV